MNDQHVTTGPAAKAIGVHKVTLWRYYRKGLVSPARVTLGGQLRWDVEDLRRQVTALETARTLPLPATEVLFSDE